MTHPASIMTEIVNHVQSIEDSTMQLMKGKSFFGKFPSLKLPDFEHAELAVLRSVSWFYAMYQELGKPNITFVVDKFKAYGIDVDKQIRHHHKDVRNLRTLFQHNLNPISQSDNNTRRQCEKWFQKYCTNPYPETDTEWQSVLIGLLTEAKNFLSTIQSCIRKISDDDSVDQIILQWEHRIKRYHPKQEFVRIISIVGSDLGRPGINANDLCNRYYSNWISELDLLETYDFEREARLMIERAIVLLNKPKMPITSTDIMEEFSIEPGRKLGSVLEMAMDIFDKEPCTREELIEKLKAEFQIE